LFLAGPIALLSGAPRAEDAWPDNPPRGMEALGGDRFGSVVKKRHDPNGASHGWGAARIHPMTFNNPYDFDVYVRYGKLEAVIPPGGSLTLG
jgi:hypothetical protein